MLCPPTGRGQFVRSHGKCAAAAKSGILGYQSKWHECSVLTQGKATRPVAWNTYLSFELACSHLFYDRKTKIDGNRKSVFNAKLYTHTPDRDATIFGILPNCSFCPVWLGTQRQTTVFRYVSGIHKTYCTSRFMQEQRLVVWTFSWPTVSNDLTHPAPPHQFSQLAIISPLIRCH